MLSKQLKWYPLFDHISELEQLLELSDSKVYRNMFGEILFVKDQGNYYAFKNKCPHQNKSLENCKVLEGQVICPWHQYQYSCETGRGHGLYIDKYPLKFENDAVFIGKEVWTLFAKK